LAEESGHHGGADTEFSWLIDPLDGTNNYALGVPMFGVCLTVCSQGATDLAGATVSWVQDCCVDYDGPFRKESCELLERHAKRMIRTWSPSIGWGLLARGEIAALVAYRNEPWDLFGGLLIAQEAGAVSFVTDHCVVIGHAETVAHLTGMLSIDRRSVTPVEEISI